jgi:predicted TIM-barrel fold metal-dependent hydrolase
MRIDADAHVDETEATWEFMADEDRFKPISIDPGVPTVPGDKRAHRRWVVNGHFGVRRWRDDQRTGTTQTTRELIDIDARLRHMDELRIDVQVLYPTFMLYGISWPVGLTQPEAELALARSYNRWMGTRTAESHGRLRWVAVTPTSTMDQALEEVRWAKDHGACGVMPRGEVAKQRAASDPYFFPLYRAASDLDLPLCLHEGSGSGPHLFTQLVTARIPDQFPSLRVGWIETGASWVPYLCTDLQAKDRRLRPLDLREDLFRSSRFYVTCESTDDLPYILQFGTEDSLMVGTDYSHADQASEIEALDIVEQRVERGELSKEIARKILDDNPRRFYGL